MNPIATTQRFHYFAARDQAPVTGSRRAGLSLLEVILSIAILGGAMVVIGQLLNLGYRSAVEAKIRSDANILADSKMAEVAAGVLELQSAAERPFNENPDWLYSVQVQQSPQLGLLMVTVTVEQSPVSSANPISFSLVRFVPDPDYDPLDYIEEQQ